MPKVEIIKQDIVVIHPDPQNMSEDESYLHFADQSGAMHRIKKNRTSAIELIKNNPGKAVSLNYGSYMNKEFIHTVDLVGDKLPPSVEPPKDMTPPRAAPVKMDSKNRSFALAYAKDIGVAKIMMGGDMSTMKIITIAEIFESYLDGGVVIKSKKEE